MWPYTDGPHRMLTCGGIVVLLPAQDECGPAQLPEPGYRRLRDSISGAKHGGRAELDDFPTAITVGGSACGMTVLRTRFRSP